MTIRATNCCTLIVTLALAALPHTGSVAAAPNDATVRFLEERVQDDPLDFTVHNRLAGAYIRLMRETGDLAYLDRAAASARASLAAVPASQNAGGLAALALAEFESHHFAEALALAQRAYDIDPRNTAVLATAGDAQLELGNYAAAEKIYQRLASDDSSPPILARLARLAELRGDNEKAIDLLRPYQPALLADGVPPHEVAWYQVRLGELYFRTGNFARAEEQYQAALKLWPESYLALAHLAELRAAQTKYDEAMAIYLKVIGRVPRAEFFQALGDLYMFMGKPEDAKPWHERALAAYLQSVAQGKAHYVHHLAGFYTDSQENPGEALRWAREDLAGRRSIYAYDSLAWALYKNGEFSEALKVMNKALVMGTQDAHLLYHAGLIYSRAGNLEQGAAFLKQAVSVNPRYNAFHVHR